MESDGVCRGKCVFASGTQSSVGGVSVSLGSRPCGTFRGTAVAHPSGVVETVLWKLSAAVKWRRNGAAGFGAA